MGLALAVALGFCITAFLLNTPMASEHIHARICAASPLKIGDRLATGQMVAAVDALTFKNRNRGFETKNETSPVGWVYVSDRGEDALRFSRAGFTRVALDSLTHGDALPITSMKPDTTFRLQGTAARRFQASLGRDIQLWPCDH